MGHLTASQYGLRARVDAHERPLGQQTDRQRAMQAAFEVLKGTISATSAMSKYRVNSSGASARTGWRGGWRAAAQEAAS